MKIVLASDKFKGCLSAEQVCDAMAEGIRAVDPSIEIDACPMSDGGEGFVAAMVRACGGQLLTRRVTGPLPEMKVDATFGLIDLGKTAVIEMSSASGLHLLTRDQCDPFAATTFGTGELINHAIEVGAAKVVLGIGGSATNDAGIGCAQACGLPVILDDAELVSMTEPLCGRDVERVALIKHGRGDRIGNVEIVVACDVTNPLYGPNGATRVYGPQKGATSEQIDRLDRALEQLAHRCDKMSEANLPGAGAAGGLGFALLAFFGATLVSGARTVATAVRLPDRLHNADFCVTGEGCVDAQSLQGKVVGTVIAQCREEGVRCGVVAGSMGAGVSLEEPAVAVQSPGMPLETALREAPSLIAARTGSLMQNWLS